MGNSSTSLCASGPPATSNPMLPNSVPRWPSVRFPSRTSSCTSNRAHCTSRSFRFELCPPETRPPMRTPRRPASVCPVCVAAVACYWLSLIIRTKRLVVGQGGRSTAASAPMATCAISACRNPSRRPALSSTTGPGLIESGRKSEAPAPAARQDKTAGRTELPHQLRAGRQPCADKCSPPRKAAGCLSKSHRPQHWPMGKNPVTVSFCFDDRLPSVTQVTGQPLPGRAEK